MSKRIPLYTHIIDKEKVAALFNDNPSAAYRPFRYFSLFAFASLLPPLLMAAVGYDAVHQIVTMQWAWACLTAGVAVLFGSLYIQEMIRRSLVCKKIYPISLVLAQLILMAACAVAPYWTTEASMGAAGPIFAVNWLPAVLAVAFTALTAAAHHFLLARGFIELGGLKRRAEPVAEGHGKAINAERAAALAESDPKGLGGVLTSRVLFSLLSAVPPVLASAAGYDYSDNLALWAHPIMIGAALLAFFFGVSYCERTAMHSLARSNVFPIAFTAGQYLAMAALSAAPYWMAQAGASERFGWVGAASALGLTLVLGLIHYFLVTKYLLRQ
jgi:hypothetical protein